MVLIAEDEASLRSMLQLALRSEGYDVVLCEDGEAAITTLERLERVDIALLDLRMPRLSGQEVLTWIRRHPRYAALPVVTMSAFSDDLQAAEIRARGASAFLPKPFSLVQLFEVIAGLLAPIPRTRPSDNT